MRMKQRKRLTAALILTAVMVLFSTGIACASESGANTKATLTLSASGNTVYVDVAGVWSTIDGSVVFDPANQVTGHGVTEGLNQAVEEQHKLNIPAENLMSGEYAFAGVFSSISGEGVEYTGHAFYLTFAQITQPITLTLKDTEGNILQTLVADGTVTEPAPTAAGSGQVSGTPEEGNNGETPASGTPAAGSNGETLATGTPGTGSNGEAPASGTPAAGSSRETQSPGTLATEGNDGTVQDEELFTGLTIALIAGIVLVLVMIVVFVVVRIRKNKGND